MSNIIIGTIIHKRCSFFCFVYVFRVFVAFVVFFVFCCAAWFWLFFLFLLLCGVVFVVCLCLAWFWLMCCVNGFVVGVLWLPLAEVAKCRNLRPKKLCIKVACSNNVDDCLPNKQLSKSNLDDCAEMEGEKPRGKSAD